jgi:hypothetical protein
MEWSISKLQLWRRPHSVNPASVTAALLTATSLRVMAHITQWQTLRLNGVPSSVNRERLANRCGEMTRTNNAAETTPTNCIRRMKKFSAVMVSRESLSWSQSSHRTLSSANSHPPSVISLLWKKQKTNKRRLMRLPCCLCLLNAWTNLYETSYVYHGTWAHLNSVLHKSLPSVSASYLYPSTFARRRIGKQFPRQWIHTQQ